MYGFDFLFMIFRCVNEKVAEFWMKNDEKLMKIVPFDEKSPIEALMYCNDYKDCYWRRTLTILNCFNWQENWHKVAP